MPVKKNAKFVLKKPPKKRKSLYHSRYSNNFKMTVCQIMIGLLVENIPTSLLQDCKVTNR